MDSLRRWLRARRIEAVIPSTATRTVPQALDHMKNWRRIATRYDRLARNYLAALALIAAVTEWAK